VPSRAPVGASVPSVPDYPEDLELPLTRGDLSLLGVGWRELAGPLWRTPFRDVHVWSATDRSSPRQRALEAAPLLPDQGAVGGWAAAAIGNAVELDGRGPSGDEQQPVLLCLPRSARVRRGPGVLPLRSRLDDGDITEVDGIRVTTPLRTAFDIARRGTLEEGVVAVDYLARGRGDFLEHLADYARAHQGLHGARRVLGAVGLASDRSRSPGETRLRLLWVREAGLARPEVNAQVHTLDGFLLGMPDLLDPVHGVFGEYDGANHRQLAQHTQDNAREEWLENAGGIVVRATAPDLGLFRRRTVERLRAAFLRGQATPPGRRGWTWDPGPLPGPTPHW
jgi:hypothetical protein